MTNHTADASLSKIARIAGFAYLFILIGYILSWTFVYSKLIVAENFTTTANNIKANELLFRIGITSDLMIVISVIVLAWAQYIILKTVNKNFALFALYLRLADAILSAVTMLFSFIALQILNGEAYLTVFKPEQLQALVGLFLNVRTPAFTIPMVFNSLASIVFLYLFFKSKYIPRILAGFGILSYSFLLIVPCVNILVPTTTRLMMGNIIEIICYSPSCLFELLIGLWLLFKGVNVQQGDSRAPESA